MLNLYIYTKMMDKLLQSRPFGDKFMRWHVHFYTIGWRLQ